MSNKLRCPKCNGANYVEHDYLSFMIPCDHPHHQKRSQDKDEIVKAITQILDGMEIMPRNFIKNTQLLENTMK
jgi:hypothetical protein